MSYGDDKGWTPHDSKSVTVYGFFAETSGHTNLEIKLKVCIDLGGDGGFYYILHVTSNFNSLTLKPPPKGATFFQDIELDLSKPCITI